jgi:glycosyltransferase involved in cell wall biosynthesis
LNVAWKNTDLSQEPSETFAFAGLTKFVQPNSSLGTSIHRTGLMAPNVRAWLGRVDHMLRSDAVAEEIVGLARGMMHARERSCWEALLEALIDDAKSATIMRRQQGRLRSLWGITPIIGLPVGVKADRTLGVEAESLVLTTYYYTKAFDINLSHHLKLIRATEPVVEQGFYWLVLAWALLSYDVFFFYNDRGILPPVEFTGRLHIGIRRDEMALIRRAEKLLYTLPYGADYRRRDRAMADARFNFCMDCPDIGKFCFCNDDVWPIVFENIAAYATAMLGTGLAAREIPGSRRLDFVVVDTDTIKPNYTPWEPGRNIRLLHVPNHMHFKGSRYLKEAVERLSAEAPIELNTSSGISNTEVLQLMSQCDLVVDQLIGGHFGLTALEAMAVGKPVIVYIADMSTVVAPEECPFINANPDTIDLVLRDIMADPSKLLAIGQRSRAYVERHYSVSALATRLRHLYRDTAGVDVPFAAVVGTNDAAQGSAL